MKKYLLALFILFIPLMAPAVSTLIIVKKVKGQTALIQFQGSLNPGENYTLVSGAISDADLKTGPRTHRLGVNLNFASLKTKTSSVEYNPTEFTIDIDFGWNYEKYEIGPILGYSSISTGFGGSTSYLTIGGFYDYNFSENKEPVTSLFGFGLKLTYTNIIPSSSATGLFNTVIYPNLFWKWWPFGRSTAFKLDVGYDIENGKDSASSSVTTTGVKSTGALLFYY